MAQAATTRRKPTPAKVARSFVKQYFGLLCEKPQELFRFYKDDSRFTRSDGPEVVAAAVGKEAINKKIASFDFSNVVVGQNLTVDHQASQGGGVLVVVVGRMSIGTSYLRPFTQTFFLAPQADGYYVLNDSFRFIPDAEPTEAPAQPEPEADAAAAAAGAAVAEVVEDVAATADQAIFEAAAEAAAAAQAEAEAQAVVAATAKATAEAAAKAAAQSQAQAPRQQRGQRGRGPRSQAANTNANAGAGAAADAPKAAPAVRVVLQRERRARRLRLSPLTVAPCPHACTGPCLLRRRARQEGSCARPAATQAQEAC